MFDIKQLLINLEDKFPDCKVTMSEELDAYQFNLQSEKFEVSVSIPRVRIIQAQNISALTELVCSELKNVADVYLQ